MDRRCEYCGSLLADTATFCASCCAKFPPLVSPVFVRPIVPVQEQSWIPAFPRGGELNPQMNQRYKPKNKPRAVPKKKKSASARINSNWIYVAWFFFYFILFSVGTGGIAIILYLITVPIAFSPLAEKLWRKVSGVRPLRLKSEKERLLPLFKEVYVGAVRANPNLSRGIKLYIKEDMNINAFAFGKSTLVLTRGSLVLLNDNCLKGLMAHEFGHFSNRDTEAVLLATVSNFFMSFVISKLTDLKNRFDSENKGGFIAGLYKILFYYPFKAIESVGELILMHRCRQNEYQADSFALNSGFGKDITDVLIEIYGVSFSKPQSVKEQLKNTHPHITLRIERLETALYY